jgi:hypothetical protein
MLEETAKGIRDRYKETEVLISKTDVTVKEDGKNLFAQVKVKFGRGVVFFLLKRGCLKR